MVITLNHAKRFPAWEPYITFSAFAMYLWIHSTLRIFYFGAGNFRLKNAQIIDNRELHNFEDSLWDKVWCVLFHVYAPFHIFTSNCVDSFFCLLLIDARIQNSNAKRTSNYARSQTKVSQEHIIVETWSEWNGTHRMVHIAEVG